MTAIGALLAFQPGLNAQLAKRTSLLMAVCASTVIAATALVAVVAAAGQAGTAARVVHAPPIYLVGGVLSALLVVGMMQTLPILGAAGIVAAGVTGQLAVSALLDHFGVLETQQISFTPLRAAGIGLLVLGTVLVTSR